MKQKRNMLSLLGILIVLVILYLALNHWNQTKEKTQEAEEKKKSIQLTDADSITEFKYSNGETTLSFVKEEDTWYLEDDKDTALNQDTIEGIVDMIENLEAKRELKQPDALEDYGLEQPSYTVWYTEDETTHTIYVGDLTGEDYYVTTDEKDIVYTMDDSLVYSMNFNLTELIETTDTEETEEIEETEE